MKKVDATKDHAEYSASASERWMKCPGSHMRSLMAPPQPESPYAAEGTLAHECLEFILKNCGDPKAAIGQAYKTYPEEMVNHAVDAVEWILNRADELGCPEILCETRVDSSPFTKPGQFGTTDAAIVAPFDTLVVIDYKYGAGIAVDPRDENGELNSQMAYYALGLSYAHDHNFEKVEIVVIQPRAWHESGETVRTATASMDELLSWHGKFKSAVIATEDPKAPLNAGKWCKFCPVAIECPEIKDNAMKQAQLVFSDTKGLVSAPDPALVPIPNLSTILAACDKLEEWVKKVRDYAFDYLQRGGEIEGFKLVEKRGVRKWVDAKSVEQDGLLYFGDDIYEAPKMLSPAQLEKKFKKDKSIKDWVAERTTSVSSGLTLVSASDKRPVAGTLDSVFGVVE